MISRRKFAKLSAAAAGAVANRRVWLANAAAEAPVPTSALAEFGYGDVTITSDLHDAQLRETHAVRVT